MAFVTGEVVLDPGARTFWVQFKMGDEILSQWPVPTKAQGEADIIDTLRRLAETKGSDW